MPGVLEGAFLDLASEWTMGYSEKNDPVVWVQGKKEFPWSKQREIMTSVKTERYTAVHSAHDLGKSFVASRIIAWWIDSFPPGEAFVVSTAPSAQQVSAIMWREVTKIHKKGKLPGSINRSPIPSWYIDGELVGYGRKPADYEESAFQGIHARYVLVVIDEAGGVPRHLYDAVDALATNENARVLAIGNPDDPASHFASICKPESGWNVIHLDGLRSPNMTREQIIGGNPAYPRYPLLDALMEAEGVPFSEEVVPEEIRPMLISPLWIEERIQRWAGVSAASARTLGREELKELVRNRCNGSSLFTAKVRGLFPTSASEGVIPLGWIQRAVERWHDLHDRKKHLPPSAKAHVPGPKQVGVDVARTGADETCLAIRWGSYVPTLKRMRITDTMEVAQLVADELHEPGSAAVVDVIGIGAGVYDRLRMMKRDGQIVGTPLQFNASASSGRRDKLGQFQFFNDRAAAWWGFREKLDPAFGSLLAIPDDEALIEELAAPKYELYANGKLKVESKDDIRRRIGRSTDSADAVIQVFWVEAAPTLEGIPYAETPVTAGQRRGDVYDYGFEGFSEADMSVGLGHGSLGVGDSVDWDTWDQQGDSSW